MSPMDTCSFLESLGDEARILALKHFRTRFHIATKSDDTPVTVADREIERRLRELILSRYPLHDLVGEEEGGEIGEGITWVIDPIDGTKSFVAGLPLFGTLVAVLENRLPAYGMIEVPALHERWIGYGNHTVLNWVPCKVSRCTHLGDARLCTTDPEIFVGEASEAFSILSRRTVRISRFGTDCYGYALLASGHVDLVAEAGLEIYDVAALIPVVRGAGGVVTTWSGHPVNERFDGTIIAAATSELHAEALRVLGHA
ncbi:inositol monophosphatase family protein [Paraburkholderia phymatum]|uniref:Inositol monophosphatase family protein n=1 Tax=Paraburkholderia phymatum TaxID=148447 RepID=A0ACC6U8E2_9BURK